MNNGIYSKYKHDDNLMVNPLPPENVSYVGEGQGCKMTHSSIASWWDDESKGDTVEVAAAPNDNSIK